MFDEANAVEVAQYAVWRVELTGKVVATIVGGRSCIALANDRDAK